MQSIWLTNLIKCIEPSSGILTPCLISITLILFCCCPLWCISIINLYEKNFLLSTKRSKTRMDLFYDEGTCIFDRKLGNIK
ncbi:hypothetical protein ACJX0J_008326, partial [Zea mays]